MAVATAKARTRSVSAEAFGAAPRRRGRRANPKGRARRTVRNGRTAAILELEFPRDTLVRELVLRLGAARSEETPLEQAGDVRTDQDVESATVFVVDFGVLRTVSGVSAPRGTSIASVKPWLGLGFGDSVGSRTEISRFDELQTERLQITLQSPVSLEAMATGSGLVLPGPPADLDLTFADTVLARYPGRVEPTAASELTFDSWNRDGERLLDVTEQIAGELGDSQDPSVTTLTLTLAAAAPGRLSLAVESLVTSRLRRVQIADQQELLLDLSAESHRTFDLGFSERASVEGARVRLTGEMGDVRVLDPKDPPVSSSAHLVADVHRAFAVKLPATRGLATLTGVRLPLVPPEAEVEARISLWTASEAGEPESRVEDGASEPVTLGASVADAGGEVWTTFPLVTEIDLETTPAAWVSLEVVRGSVDMTLAEAGGPSDQGGSAFADVRLGTSAGEWRRLPAVFAPGEALESLLGRARVLGRESEEGPRLPLRLAVDGAVGGVDIDPAGQVVEAEFELDSPLEIGPGLPTPRLAVTFYSPGSVRLEEVDLIWVEPAAPAVPARRSNGNSGGRRSEV